MDNSRNSDLLTDHEETLRLLRRLSLQDFLHVGMDQIAYIRALPHAGESGEHLHAIYAADGSQISVMESYDMAETAIRMNDLVPVTVH